MEIYVMNANGSGVTRLTIDPAPDKLPGSVVTIGFAANVSDDCCLATGG